MGRKWKPSEIEALHRMAGERRNAGEIAAALGCTRQSVVYKANSLGIAVEAWTAEERAVRAEKKSEINRRRERRKTERRREARKENEKAIQIRLPAGASKTSPIYRNQLPRIPEMTVGERRNMLAEAVRNTAAMGVE